MKTSIRTLALLFASVAFAACANRSIDPVRPATQMTSDTTHRLVQNPTKSDPQPRVYLSEKMILAEGVEQDNALPEPIVEPTPYPVSVPAPRPAVMPVEQVNALNN